MQIGLPPKVLACEPGTQSMMSAFVMQMPSGIPDAMPLAMQTMSGSTPECSMAHHFPVRAGAGLDLVGDQQDAMAVADAADLLQEVGRGDDIAAFALDGLDEDGGDFFGRQDGLEELLFDVAGATEREGFFFLRAAATAAIGIGIANVRDAGDKGSEAALLLGLRAGERERAHGAAVEGAEEADDVLAAGVVAGELHGALDGFGAGVAVVEPVRAGHGRDGGEALGEGGHVFVVEVGAGHVDQLGGLILDGLDDFGVAVAGGGDGDAGGEVEELVAVDVGDADAATGFGDQGIAAGVAGRDETIIGLDDFLGVGARERGLDPGAELGVVPGTDGFAGGVGDGLRGVFFEVFEGLFGQGGHADLSLGQRCVWSFRSCSCPFRIWTAALCGCRENGLRWWRGLRRLEGWCG